LHFSEKSLIRSQEASTTGFGFSGARFVLGEGLAEEIDDSAGTEEKPEEKPPATAEDLAALRAELEAEKGERIRLQGQLDALNAAPPARPTPPEKKKEFTRIELQQMVDAGTIDEAKMAEVLEQQRDGRLLEKVRAEIQAGLSEAHARSAADAEFAKYRARLGGLDTPGHPNRERVSREFAALRALGAPEGASTELAALRAAFGPADAIKEKTAEENEGHREAGGAGSGGEPPSKPSWQKGLSKDRISYLQGQLNSGFYKGVDDPAFKSYVKFARTPKATIPQSVAQA
jgi:hypothetical protein